ncbi:uncharacterized protein MELLADRAFT_61850 [Melampsora larici-populina 98AG31]|uniref:J domain-containing protein n=1 Tax=Melampsora larici-populina (strain 98AG31 / pathotype 3-4-7) TaxID=747676 RepID=F4RG42_MELLP|nr:uncharacterized protein MELLADRAFT_61850 [Melampsora larici-populina 98AG31]EGG08542.1 hypothetical protein MELLADRAFT_61850 [Melampsora larici-populina 98AG31]
MSQTIITSRLREPYVAVTCAHCKATLEYLPPPKPTSYLIQCSQCSKTFSPPGSSNPTSTSTPPKPNPTTKKSGSRRIGTDERPLETEFYDVLGISPQATSGEIKSAYRRLALKMHPDKNPDDPTAEDKFKTLARAYNTLSDPALRKKYNEFGKQQDIEEGFVDPEAVFSTLFGGERFQDIIGTISLGQEMKTALQKESEEEEIEGSNETQLVSKSTPSVSPPKPISKSTKANLTAEQKAKKAELAQKESAERARVRELRVSHLAEVLTKKLYLYTEQADQEVDEQIINSVRMIWTIEKEMLAEESFGPELLRTVGQVYVAKSKRYLSATTSGGWGGVGLVGGWIHSAKSTAHVFSETVGAVRAAYDVKAVFDEIAKAEAEGGTGMTEERKKELEEEAARKGLRALFKGAKLEVESVIREVCDRILEDPGLSREQARKRAVALEILGSVYETAQNKNGEDPLGLESGYVKVDKKKPTSTTTTSTPKA